MRTKQRTRLTLGFLGALAFGAGCTKSAERERREAERAMAEADKKTAQADEEAAKKTHAAEQKAAGKMADFLTAVNREESDYTLKLHDEVDRIEKQLGKMKVDVKADGTAIYDEKSKDAKEIKRLLGRRDALRADLQALGRVSPHDWPTLKARVDRDVGNRNAVPGTEHPFGT
jgi:hypothetical protein